MCRTCHDRYGAGFNTPMQKAIDRIWGEGTVERLEELAMSYPTIKKTPLDTIDFRLKLEKYYKKLIKHLKQDIPLDDLKKVIGSTWGAEIEHCLQGEK